MGECFTSTKNESGYMEKLDPPTRKWYKEKLLVVSIHKWDDANFRKTIFLEIMYHDVMICLVVSCIPHTAGGMKSYMQNSSGL